MICALCGEKDAFVPKHLYHSGGNTEMNQNNSTEPPKLIQKYAVEECKWCGHEFRHPLPLTDAEMLGRPVIEEE